MIEFYKLFLMNRGIKKLKCLNFLCNKMILQIEKQEKLLNKLEKEY